MKADQFIVSRVSSETKARLRALAEKELLSESAMLRRLVEMVLLKAGLAPIIAETPTGARARRGARLMIRLRPDDQILLRERAAARGMPPATYVSVLTRAHLRSLAPLPQEDLLALKRTLAELGSIGRNLNQIARAANQGQLVTSPGVGFHNNHRLLLWPISDPRLGSRSCRFAHRVQRRARKKPRPRLALLSSVSIDRAENPLR